MRLMEEATQEYQTLEEGRTSLQLAFGILYLGFALIVLLSAIWTAIAVADRLVRPIRVLIGASDDVASGNLDVVVPVHASDGDVGSLAQTFNNMIVQIRTQRDEILSAKDQIDDRRRFTEAVLSGVSAGVVGVDHNGSVTIANRSACEILGGWRSRGHRPSFHPARAGVRNRHGGSLDATANCCHRPGHAEPGRQGADTQRQGDP
jgi:two-component system nitrogen regulation sensor histidine kinase NtrY